MLQVILHGCVTWTLALVEEHKLQVHENEALRKNIWK